MRRILVIATVLVVATGAAAFGLAASINLVSPRLAAAALVQRLSNWTGAQVTIGSARAGSVFPSLTVELTDVSLTPRGDHGGARLTAPHATVSLRLLPLLSARISFGTLALYEPQFHLAADDSGSLTPAGDGRAIRAALALLPLAELDRLVVRDGTAVLDDRGGAASGPAMTAVDLDLAWQRPGQGIALNGAFNWQGEKLSVDAQIDSLPAVLGSKGSGASFGFTAAPLADAIAPASNSKGDTAEVPGGSLRTLVKSLAVPAMPWEAVQTANLTGTLFVSRSSVSLTGASLDSSAGAAEGYLSLRFDGPRPALSGSLSVDAVDATPLAAALTSERGGEILSTLRAPPTDWLPGFDLDLRTSIDRIAIGLGTISDVIASVALRDGHFDIRLTQADIAGGSGRGTFAIDSIRGHPAEPANTTAHLFLNLKEFSATEVARTFWPAPIAELLGEPPGLSGTGTLAVDLSAHGGSPQQMIDSLDGSLALDIEDGSFGGADLEASLDKLTTPDATPIVNGYKPYLPVGGRTYFSTMGVRLQAQAGTFRASRIWINGDRSAVTLSGSLDARSADIDGQGTAVLFATPGNGNDRSRPLIELPFGVGGTLQAPNISPGIPKLPPDRTDRTTAQSGGVLPALAVR